VVVIVVMVACLALGFMGLVLVVAGIVGAAAKGRSRRGSE
jgi:hypothetical protein